MRLTVWLVAIIMLGGATVVSPASAQTEFPGCGELDLVFRNPDLRPQPDGFLHAAGQFFVQFQAIGSGADQIDTFGFSFGPDSGDYDESICDRPVWFTGPYVLNYRADRDPSDGFFIPLKTDLVPDGQYAAAVHAYDANNNELARFWARAIVDNCDGDPPARCTDDIQQQTPRDNVAPWPIILPGDGQAMEGQTLTIEFAEALTNLTVELNGVDITGDLKDWEGRVWDADYFPDYGPAGVGNLIAPPCTQPFHTCTKYGPAYAWDGRDLTNDDVVRVTAEDLNGNVAVKDVHIGSGIAGGAVTEGGAVLQITAQETKVVAAPGETAVFQFVMQNSGGGTAHPFSTITAPEGWTADMPHAPVEPGAEDTQELAVVVPPTAEPGTYAINVTIEYQSSGQGKERSWELKVQVNAPSTVGPTEPESEPEDEESPSAPIALIGLIILGVALVLGRTYPEPFKKQ